MFKFFDRYIIREIIPPFFIGFLVYTFVLLMNQILLLSELFITRGVSFNVAVDIFVYLIPSILAFTVPMAVLMGILAGLSRLSSDSEIVAFKTLGISCIRLLKPILVFSLGGWLLTSFLALYLAPHANYKWVQTLTKSVLTKVQFRIYPREFNESIPNIVLFIQDIRQDRNWENIFVYSSASPEEPRVILARTGKLNFYPEMKRATLELFDGTVHSVPLAEPEKYSMTSFKHLVEDINVESLFSSYSSEKRVREKDVKELLVEIKVIKQDLAQIEKQKREIGLKKTKKGDPQLSKISLSYQQRSKDYRSHWVEVHKKFALPFVCLIFGFLGLPLGVSTKKGGRTSGFTISLGIILLYYILITGGEKIAMDGRISPFIGMWGPNFILLVAAAYLFAKTLKETPLFSSFARFFKKREKVASLSKIKFFSLKFPRLSLRFPNILDRYTIRKYLAIFSLVFLSLLSISVIVTFFERIDNVYQHNQPLILLLKYIQYSIPEFIHYILPVTALTTTLLALGLLTKFNEVTAMKACGISVYRIIIPVVLMAVLVSVLSFYLQERILPYSNKKAEETWNKINELPPRTYTDLNRRWVLSRKKDRIYHYSYFDPNKAAFSPLSIYDIELASWSLKKRIYAEKAYLAGEELSLKNCWSRTFVQEKPITFEKKEEMELAGVESKSYFLKEWKEPSQMNYLELRQYIREIAEMGFETSRFKVDLAYKISFPLVSLIMTLLGIPFAFSMGKRGTLVGIGLSIVIAMVYWGTIGVFKSLGYVNFLNPFLAAWGPNLIFGLLGLYLIFRLRT
jgi:LPS export ABC transporter permease LptG/LPS export ABC transporter permease LptF